jgi:hypothetical protein
MGRTHIIAVHIFTAYVDNKLVAHVHREKKVRQREGERYLFWFSALRHAKGLKLGRYD